MNGKITGASGAGSESLEMKSLELTSLERTSLELSRLEEEIASLETERLWLKELSKSIDNVPDVIPYQIVVRSDGSATFTFFGSHITRIADYTAEEALADYWTIAKRISKQDMPEFDARAVLAAHNRTTFDFTSYHKSFNGSVRRTRLHVNPEFLSTEDLWWHGYLSEVEADDKTTVEEEVSRGSGESPVSANAHGESLSNDSLGYLLTGGLYQSNDIFILTELDGKMLFINDAFAALTGCAIYEMQKREIFEYLCSEYVQFFQENGSFPQGKVQYLCKTGETKTVIQSATPVYENGEIINLIIVARDISKELDFLNRLDKVKHLESMGTLASSIAHDLNNVLQAIMIYASCIEEPHKMPSKINGCPSRMDAAPSKVDNAPSIINDAPSMIVKSCERAASLVTRILSHTRQSQKEPVIFDGISVLDECTALLNLSNPGLIGTKSEQAECADRVTIFCDPNDFRQLIICICSFVRTLSDSRTSGLYTTSDVCTTSVSEESEDISQKGGFKLNLTKRDGLPVLLAEFQSNETVHESSIDFVLLKELVYRIGGKIQLSHDEEAIVGLEVLLPGSSCSGTSLVIDKLR
jgi:PAS domain S-box-containing protein